MLKLLFAFSNIIEPRHNRALTHLLIAMQSGILLSCSPDDRLNKPGNLLPRTVMDDSALPAFEVNGARLHLQAFGPPDSTLIICLHGGPGNCFRYLMNCKTLADKGYRVVFYDQRGSGLSQRFSMAEYTISDVKALERAYYDDLRAIIAAQRRSPVQKVVLLGHSWGAMLASAYAGKYPQEIAGLILAEPGGLKWEDIDTYISSSRSFGPWSEALNDVTYLDQFLMGRSNDHELLDYKVALQSSGNVLVGDVASSLGENAATYPFPRDGAVIATAMFAYGEKHKPDLGAGLDQYNPKVLFFYSSNNQAYPDSWAIRIASAYKSKELIQVPGVGHSGMFDQISAWKDFTEPRILAYLQSMR